MEWILLIVWIIPALLLAIALFFTIRAWKKGTLWSNNISSALGGAVLGVLLVVLFALYLFFTIEGQESFYVMWGAMFGIPIFAILGAIIFILIGATKRKNVPFMTQGASLTTPPSVDSESEMIESSENLTSMDRIIDKPTIAILTILICGVLFFVIGPFLAILGGAIFYYFFGNKKR
jgi:hypothetical protein